MQIKRVFSFCTFIYLFLKKRNKISTRKKIDSNFYKSKMETILSIKDEDMVTLEFICEEIKEQLKLISMLVERYKQKKPHLKEQFKAKKQLWFQIVHDESSNVVEVRK